MPVTASAGLAASHPGRRLAPAAATGWIVLLLACAEFLWEFHAPRVQINDAYISYRYAYNLVAGHGLVFNVGEYVEGYTNLLWTLLVAAGMRLGLDGPQTGHLLSLVFGVASLIVAYIYADLLVPRRFAWMAAFAPIVLLASNAFVRWSMAGLETPLFVFLVTLAAILAFRGRMGWVALVCMLATLTRPDGALLAAVFLGVHWCIAVARAPRRLTPILRRSGPVAAYALFCVVLTAFRIAYYGDPLPNTFYAKVGDIPVVDGWIYARNFLVDGPGLLLIGMVAAAWWVPRTRVALVYGAVTAAYVISIGGDVFQNGRFFLPVLPLMTAASIAGACHVLARHRLVGYGLAALLPLCCLCSLFAFWPSHWGRLDSDYMFTLPAPGTLSAKRNGAKQNYVFSQDNDEYQIAAVARLRTMPRPVHMIATIGVGRLGYYAEDITILDLVGLLDRHIARSTKSFTGSTIFPGHSRTDSAYVLSRRPDIIEIPPRGFSVSLPALVDLWSNPDLDRLYVYAPGLGYVLR